MIRGAPDCQRGPDIQNLLNIRAPLTKVTLGSLMMTLAVTGAPDSHRGTVFLVGPDG